MLIHDFSLLQAASKHWVGDVYVIVCEVNFKAEDVHHRRRFQYQ